MSGATKFTPGPWSAVELGDERLVLGRPTWGCTWHGQKGRWEVARLDDAIAAENPEESEANHHLIAAAPELYALAIRAETLLPMLVDVPAAQRLMADLSAILAKARGEA